MHEPLAKHPITTERDFKLWREFDMGWTQDKCAIELGYKSRQSIAKLETGRAKITTRISGLLELISSKKFNK
tara:strand:+ start:630 stop:845 length:216 start_codon:yes stop_codon:yes gene_type:complete